MKKMMSVLAKKETRITRTAILLLLVFAIFISILCLEYYQSLKQTVFDESSGYLLEMSKQMGANVDKVVNDNYAILGTIQTILQSAEGRTLEQLRPLLQRQQSYWSFEDIMLVDDSGKMTNVGGKTISVADDSFLRKAVVDRQRSMSAAQVINESECIVFAIPMDNLFIDGKHYTVLCATYNLDTFDQILTTNIYDGMAYTHIINVDGTVMVRSSSANADTSGYNLFTSLQSSVNNDESALQQMQEDIRHNRAGIISCTLNETERYLSYYPVGTEHWYLVTFVPVSLVNARSSLLMRLTLLFCGFITVSMVALVTLLMLNFLKNNRKLEKLAFVDPITGGNTLQKFQLLAQSILEKHNEENVSQHALIYLNIEKFKVINEQFGRETGDAVLRVIDQSIGRLLGDGECMGRMSADQFCILLQYTDEQQMTERFRQWHIVMLEDMRALHIELVFPAIHYGVYVVNVYTMPIPLMIDRAKLSNDETTTIFNSKIRYSLYDEKVHKKLFKEKQLEDRMEEALENGEFEVYLQPKYATKTRTICGAEALVRWSGHPDGMIYPDEFIPLFEKNGFILQLDLWVFEQVCRTIRGWIEQGLTPIPISINCSRLHLRRNDFLSYYQAVLSRYDIPHACIEMELTESMLYDNIQAIIEATDRLHEIGILCSIDDFGSGYSSLNMIQYIPVDTLKLDKIFFRKSNQSGERAASVIGSIVNMAKALSMTTVAEGVEYMEQVEMLDDLGCDVIQGYIFARPMPIPQFNQLAFPNEVTQA